LVTPTLQHLDGVIETIIGTAGKKALQKNKEGNLDGTMIKFCTNQSMRYTYLRVHMLAVYQKSKSLDTIESYCPNLESIMVIPSISSDIDEWKETRKAKDYG